MSPDQAPQQAPQQLNAVGRMLLLAWMKKHARQYMPGGWDYDKEGAALVEATAAFLGEKDPWREAR